MITVNRRSYICTLTAVLVPLAFAAGQDSAAPEAPGPLDQLREENIPEYERRVAAERNGGTLPEGLVAIVGDSRWQHTANVQGIAVLPGGETCVTAGGNTLILWDLHTGDALSLMYRDSSEEFNSLSLSGDGRTLALGDRNSEATIWDLPQGRLRHRLVTKGSAVALSADGRRLVTGDGGLGEISFWDPATGQLQREISPDPGALPELKDLSIGVSRLAIHPAGTMIAAVHASVRRGPGQIDPRTVRIVLWDTVTGLPRHVLEGHSGRALRALKFSGDGRFLATCSADDHRVNLWNVAEGKLVWNYEQPNRRTVYDIAFSPGRQYLWVLVGAELIPIDVNNGRAGRAVTVPLSTTYFDFLPGGNRAVIACGGPRVLNLDTGQVEWPVDAGAGHGNLFAAAFRADNRQMATVGEDGLVVLWDLPAGQPPQRLAGHTASVRTVAYSPDGSLLVTSDIAGHLYFWDTTTGHVIQSRPGGARRTAFDANGRFLAAMGATGVVDIWDLSNWKLAQSFFPDRREIRPRSVAFLPDGKSLVTEEGIIDIGTGRVVRPYSDKLPFRAVSAAAQVILLGNRLHDLETGELVGELDVDGELISTVFSDDGRQLAAVSNTGSLIVWETHTSRRQWSAQIDDLNTFEGTLTFSHDGRHLACPAGNGTVHIIRIPLPPPQPE